MQDLLSEIIRYHRKRSGLTQIQLAELADVGKNLVYELESGKKSIRLYNLIKILQVLNIDLDFSSPLRDNFIREHTDAKS